MANLSLSLVLKLVDKLSGPAAKARAALDGVRATAGKVDQFVKLKRETLAAAAAHETATRKVAALARQLRATNAPAAKLRGEFARAKQEAGRLKGELTRQQSALSGLRRALTEAGVNTKSLAGEQRRLTRETTQLTRRVALLNGVGRVMNRVGGAARQLGERIVSAMTLSETQVKIAVAGMTVAIGYLGKTFIDTAAKFEMFQATLTALEGSKSAAQKALAWISEFAVKTPADLDGLVNAFIKARAYGLDPMDGTLQALIDQTSKLGFSQEKLEGIIMAVGQAWTKQKLQGEEIMQLLERGVPVWDLLAKATGKTAQELQALSEKGLLGRKTIQLLIETIGQESAGAAEQAQRTWSGLISNIMDNWIRFQRLVMDAGAFDYLKSRLEALTAELETSFADGSFARLAKELSEAIILAAKAVEWLITAFYKGIKDGTIKAWLLEVKAALVDIAAAARTVGAIGRFFGIGRAPADYQGPANAAEQAMTRARDRLKRGQQAAAPAEVSGKIVVQVEDHRVKINRMISNNKAIDFLGYTGKAMAGGG